CRARLDAPSRAGEDSPAPDDLLALQDRLLQLLRPEGPAAVMSAGQPAAPAQYFADLRLVCSLLSGDWPHSRHLIASHGLAESLSTGTSPARPAPGPGGTRSAMPRRWTRARPPLTRTPGTRPPGQLRSRAHPRAPARRLVQRALPPHRREHPAAPPRRRPPPGPDIRRRLARRGRRLPRHRPPLPQSIPRLGS